MKRIIIGVLCALPGLPTVAQEREQHFSYYAEAGIGVPFGTPKTTPVLLRAAAYYNPGDRWELGAGSGVSFYDKTVLIPLFAEIRFGITRPRRLTPYLACAAGYSFAPAPGIDGGLLISPAAGVKWRLRPRLRVHLAAGYEGQKMARLKSCSDLYFCTGFREKLSHRSLAVRAGITF